MPPHILNQQRRIIPPTRKLFAGAWFSTRTITPTIPTRRIHHINLRTAQIGILFHGRPKAVLPQQPINLRQLTRAVKYFHHHLADFRPVLFPYALQYIKLALLDINLEQVDAFHLMRGNDIE